MCLASAQLAELGVDHMVTAEASSTANSCTSVPESTWVSDDALDAAIAQKQVMQTAEWNTLADIRDSLLQWPFRSDQYSLLKSGLVLR
jgi:hypothetical protein